MNVKLFQKSTCLLALLLTLTAVSLPAIAAQPVVEVPLEASVTAGAASAGITRGELEAIILKAVSSNSGHIELTVNGAGGAGSVAVTLPTSSAAGLLSMTDVQVAVDTPLAKLTLDTAAVADLAGKQSESVTLTVAKDKPSGATSITFQAGTETVESLAGSVRVELPAGDLKPGMVAVLVDENGAESEVLTTSVAAGSGMVLIIDGSATVKLLDKGLRFKDMDAGNVAFARDAASYVSARGLMTGTVDRETFDPTRNMSRQMLMALMARLDGVSAQGTDTYAKGIAWAVERGVAVEGDPAANATRAELALMFWRYGGSRSSSFDLAAAGYTDLGGLTGDSLAAFRWCVENDIMHGMTRSTLNADLPTNRAQVAQMIWAFNKAMIHY